MPRISQKFLYNWEVITMLIIPRNVWNLCIIEIVIVESIYNDIKYNIVHGQAVMVFDSE